MKKPILLRMNTLLLFLLIGELIVIIGFSVWVQSRIKTTKHNIRLLNNKLEQKRKEMKAQKVVLKNEQLYIDKLQAQLEEKSVLIHKLDTEIEQRQRIYQRE